MPAELLSRPPRPGVSSQPSKSALVFSCIRASFSHPSSGSFLRAQSVHMRLKPFLNDFQFSLKTIQRNPALHPTLEVHFFEIYRDLVESQRPPVRRWPKQLHTCRGQACLPAESRPLPMRVRSTIHKQGRSRTPAPCASSIQTFPVMLMGHPAIGSSGALGTSSSVT